MLSEEKTLALRSFLGVLPGMSAFRLARLVEIDRLNGGSLPHVEILDYLRPTLRLHSERHRVPSPLRNFCMPFEDLLFSGRRLTKRKGCISRNAIEPVWHWLERKLVPKEHKVYVDNFKFDVLANDKAGCEATAATFWKVAAAAMVRAIEEDPTGTEDYFGADSALLADVAEIALLLRGGPFIMDVKALFPKPAPVPNDGRMTAFKAIYDRALDADPDVAPYLPVVAMGRLEKPWQAIRLVLWVTNQRNDAKISLTDVGLTGEILFGRMEDDQAEVLAMSANDFDADTLLDQLTEFTLLSGAITKEVDILREGLWGKRLLASRTAISAAMEGYMERAPKDIAAAIPLRSNGSGVRTLVPHFARAVDDKTAARAYRYAKLLTGCRYLASAAAFYVKYDIAVAAATDMLCFYNESLLTELRNPEWADREAVERQFSIATELTKLLLGVEAATLLSRRGTIAREAGKNVLHV